MALRGGGGGFGLVTQFRFRTRELPSITTATVDLDPGSSTGAFHFLVERLIGNCPPEVTSAATISGRPARLRIDACATAGHVADEWIKSLADEIVGDWVIDHGADLLRWQQASDASFLPPRRGAWRARYQPVLNRAEIESLS